MANGGEHLQRRGARDSGVRAGVGREREPRLALRALARAAPRAGPRPRRLRLGPRQYVLSCVNTADFIDCYSR